MSVDDNWGEALRKSAIDMYGDKKEYKLRSANDLQRSLYGDASVHQNVGSIAASSIYGFIPSNFRTFTDGSGVVEIDSDNVFSCSTGTTVLSYGTLQSFRSVKYHTGIGMTIRFSARFPSNAALTWIGAGAFSIIDELSFGYNGTDFGVWHRYGGAAETRYLDITAGASGAENATVTLNGTAYVVPLTSGTAQKTAGEIQTYFDNNVTTWVASQVDSRVYFAAQSDGEKNNTYSLSSASATGTFTRQRAGETKTSTHIPSSDWNGGTPVGFDPAQGNSYEISYQNGFGAIKYFIQDNRGDYVLVHTINAGSSGNEQNLTNPSLRVGCYAASIGGTTDVSVKLAYIASHRQGVGSKIRNPRSFSNTKSIGTTLTNILTLKNRPVYNGYYNQSEIEPVYLTLANDGAKSAIFQIRGNPTVAGDSNFQEVGTNLISLVDVAGTTVTENGRPLGSFTLAKGQSIIIDMTALEITVPPTLNLVIAGRMTSGSASDLTAALTWYEDVF